jgi:uncharacterized membrane protein YkvA (DUF1232 family)
MRSANGSLEFLRRISRRRRSAQCGVESISEYVEQSASLLTPEHLDEVGRELPILNLQFAALSVRQFPHLQQQLKLLTDFLEDTAAGVFPDGSEASRKETAFALRYMVKEADIIPDSVPEIGYADDSLIVRTVLSRHQDVFPRLLPFSKNSLVEDLLCPLASRRPDRYPRGAIESATMRYEHLPLSSQQRRSSRGTGDKLGCARHYPP